MRLKNKFINENISSIYKLHELVINDLLQKHMVISTLIRLSALFKTSI